MCMEYICGPLISLSQASVLPVRVSGLIEMSAELVADETDAYFSPRVDLTRREVEEACTVHQITWSKRSSSTIASEMKEMLNSAPAFIMLPVIMATTAAAATAVFWAWRR